MMGNQNVPGKYFSRPHQIVTATLLATSELDSFLTLPADKRK
jgi:hypothetical protein